MYDNPKLFILALAAIGVAMMSETAAAFCRTTTCDTTDPTERCKEDQRGCVVEGKKAFWPQGCTSFAVHHAGAPAQGIPFAEASAIIENAFRAWVSSDCGGAAEPSLDVWNFGALTCNEIQFNEVEPNANAWIFRNDGWPYGPGDNTLAITTVTFDDNTGEILDADVEINASTIELTTRDAEPVNDLLSIATHEAGHFLGLAHTDDSSATMYEKYSPGRLDFRSLAEDDETGICSTYPPGRSGRCAPLPAHGYATSCGTEVTELDASGCTTTGRVPRRRHSASRGALFILLLGLGAALRRRAGRSDWPSPRNLS